MYTLFFNIRAAVLYALLPALYQFQNSIFEENLVLFAQEGDHVLPQLICVFEDFSSQMPLNVAEEVEVAWYEIGTVGRSVGRTVGRSSNLLPPMTAIV